MKQILCRLGKDLSWLRPFSSVRLKRIGCDHEGGEVAQAGLPELVKTSFVRKRPLGKSKVAALPNDLVDYNNVPSRNDYGIFWSR